MLNLYQRVQSVLDAAGFTGWRADECATDATHKTIFVYNERGELVHGEKTMKSEHIDINAYFFMDWLVSVLGVHGLDSGAYVQLARFIVLGDLTPLVLRAEDSYRKVMKPNGWRWN